MDERIKADEQRGHSHVTSALWGKRDSSKADGRTDRLRDQDSDKGKAGGEGV